MKRVNTRRRIIGLFVLLSIGVVGVFGVISFMFRDLDGLAAAVNVSGSQRMRTILLAGLAPLVWSAHRRPPIHRRQGTESRFAPNANHKTILQGNSQPTGRFLQLPNDCRSRSTRFINSLQIGHGRLLCET